MSATNTISRKTLPTGIQPITVTSPSFTNMGKLPDKHTTGGINVNPAIIPGQLPQHTQSLVLLVEDPNAPIDSWVHWLVWDILPTTKITEGCIPGTEGLNAFQQHHYRGPFPSANNRYYFFKVYALNTMLHLHYSSTKHHVIQAMHGHILGYGELIGCYARQVVAHAPGPYAPDMYL